MSQRMLKGIIVGIAIGIAFGVGAYTFAYARGWSYLTDDAVDQGRDSWLKRQTNTIAPGGNRRSTSL